MEPIQAVRAFPQIALRRLPRIWGGATAFLHHSRKLRLVDLFVLLASAGILFGILALAREWHGTMRPAVTIDLRPQALPRYALLSLSRGLAAYLLSLAFTLGYGYWAAKDRLAERVLVPLLDILQSIPVLGFMPGVVLAFVSLFPHTNVGLELAAILMIFTGQAWNMTFSFYHSLRSVPPDMREAATVYRFNWWQRLRWVELPFATIGLVWNSMMSMAGGWFFLMVSEAFVLGEKDFRLPGLGSYMSVAVARGDVRAMISAVVAMTLMIILLDQVLWRPVVVWAGKFRVEEGGRQEIASSWFLAWIRRSRLLRWIGRRIRRAGMEGSRRAVPSIHASAHGTDRLPLAASSPAAKGGAGRGGAILSILVFGLLVLALGYGGVRLTQLIVHLPVARWGAILGMAGLTLVRVLAATALGTVWALPAGLAIGLSPRLSRALQPVVQVVASFPAPMLFPAVIALMAVFGIPLGWGSIVLMLLGTQWYILFNVIAGASAIPADLLEATVTFRLSRIQRFRTLLVPAVFPYLVTGWVTAAGGAWNASIVAEYVTFRGKVIAAHGLGSTISLAAERADFGLLAASIIVMAAVVVAFNRTVWRRLYNLAESRYSLSK
jgi:NitT/TauT family transport system permease protein